MKKPGGVAMAVAACSLVFLVSAKGTTEVQQEAPSPSYFSGKHLTAYTHTWPEMEMGWRIVVGTVMGFCGAALGSVGGVGGAGVYLPMLTLLIGFDTKSSAAISKCMIMGAAASTVYYNIKQRHPTLDMPVIDYDLALLFQPMLLLGISIGVTFNVIFADWMVTLLLILLCLVISTKAFFKGVDRWKKETIQKEAARRCVVSKPDIDTSRNESESKSLPLTSSQKDAKASIVKNVHWNKLGLLISVWVAIVALQIIKSYTQTCSPVYWVVNLLQIPVAGAASGYEAVMLYKGKRMIGSRGELGSGFKVKQLVFYCGMGTFAGAVGGLLGVSGGAILGPLFLDLGAPPQVSTATATFAMVFSSSMSVVEYYLLKRFPIPYTLYFVGVTVIAALAGQYIVERLIAMLGRASLVIFVLAFTIFISAFFIGIGGIVRMVHEMEHHKYMGFDSLCSDVLS